MMAFHGTKGQGQGQGSHGHMVSFPDFQAGRFVRDDPVIDDIVLVRNLAAPFRVKERTASKS